MKDEVFFSMDVEADGPIPLRNSMLSFACVAFASDGTVLGEFERNLQTLPEAKPDEKTMREFWDKEPEAWAYCTSNTVPPEQGMTDFVKWVESIPGGQRVSVCMPAGYDFTFMYMYMVNFVGRSPFSFSCVDMKTYASAMRHTNYRDSSKKSWPSRWFDSSTPHTHKAIDDAREQGLIFLKMRAENHYGPQHIKIVSGNFWNSMGGKPAVFISPKGEFNAAVHCKDKEVLWINPQAVETTGLKEGDSVKVWFSEGNVSRVEKTS